MLRLLAKERDQRPPTAQEARREIGGCLAAIASPRDPTTRVHAPTAMRDSTARIAGGPPTQVLVRGALPVEATTMRRAKSGTQAGSVEGQTRM